MNTVNLGLYKPNRLDDVEIDTSLSDNFDKIDTELGALVKNGVSVLKFGAKNDGSDSTVAFNNAINSLGPNGGVVVVPNGMTFHIQGWTIGSTGDAPLGGVKLKNNVTLVLLGATLQVIPNSSDNSTCLNISDCENVNIIGGTIIGERVSHVNSPTFSTTFDQWGYGIAIVGSRNVNIYRTVVKDCTGDGIYVGASAANGLSANVVVSHVLCDNNRRNGMSVTGLYTGTIENSTFQNTKGTSPESGLDLEPNPGKTVSDLTVRNNLFLVNNQHGLLLASIQTSARSAMYCKIEGNTARYNKLSGFYTNRADHNTFKGNIALENDNNGFAFLESKHNVIEGNQSIKNKYHGFMLGLCEHNEFVHNSSKGNSQGTTGLHDQFLFYTSHRNNIQGNTGRHMDLTTKARYGMYITSDCVANLVTNNDLHESISGTGAGGFNNASSTTHKGAGNRGNSTTWGTTDFL